MTSLPEKLAEISRSAGVYYGFGGGEGDSAESGTGSGGGGGGMSLPIGAYVKSGGSLRFEPNVISLLAVGIPFVWVAGKAISRVIRAVKR